MPLFQYLSGELFYVQEKRGVSSNSPALHAFAVLVALSLTIAAAGTSAAGNSIVSSIGAFLGFVAAESAVPVDAPEASTTLVISQAYGGGGGTTGTYIADYVEIKNISTSPQSLGGLFRSWYARQPYSSAVGTKRLRANVTLSRGNFISFTEPARHGRSTFARDA